MPISLSHSRDYTSRYIDSSNLWNLQTTIQYGYNHKHYHPRLPHLLALSPLRQALDNERGRRHMSELQTQKMPVEVLERKGGGRREESDDEEEEEEEVE